MRGHGAGHLPRAFDVDGHHAVPDGFLDRLKSFALQPRIDRGVVHKDVDAAETHFLRSLEILHSQLGANHEETAAVSNNLGALYHSAKYFEQAREMHMMALEARRELFGEQHPDTAQSHNNLALALLETGDRAWAKRHFEKALEGFEALGPGFSPDLEAVASNYCGFLREDGENSLADIIAARVQQVIGPKTA